MPSEPLSMRQLEDDLDALTNVLSAAFERAALEISHEAERGTFMRSVHLDRQSDGLSDCGGVGQQKARRSGPFLWQ